jgi:hypothetical protein
VLNQLYGLRALSLMKAKAVPGLWRPAAETARSLTCEISSVNPG